MMASNKLFGKFTAPLASTPVSDDPLSCSGCLSSRPEVGANRAVLVQAAFQAAKAVG